MKEIDADAIRRAHFEFDGDCHDCEEMWPCDVEKVATVLEATRAALEAQRQLNANLLAHLRMR